MFNSEQPMQAHCYRAEYGLCINKKSRLVCALVVFPCSERYKGRTHTERLYLHHTDTIIVAKVAHGVNWHRDWSS